MPPKSLGKKSALLVVQWAYFGRGSKIAGLREGRRILPTWWHLFFFQTPVPRSQLPVSRFRLLDIIENSHKEGTSTTLNAVAKENIHVPAKVFVNLKLIGSCKTGSQPKRIFHIVTRSSSSQINFSHKSIVGNLKSETAAEKRKIWELKRKSVKRAFKAYTLRQKRKSKQVCPPYLSLSSPLFKQRKRTQEGKTEAGHPLHRKWRCLQCVWINNKGLQTHSWS